MYKISVDSQRLRIAETQLAERVSGWIFMAMGLWVWVWVFMMVQEGSINTEGAALMGFSALPFAALGLFFVLTAGIYETELNRVDNTVRRSRKRPLRPWRVLEVVPLADVVEAQLQIRHHSGIGAGEEWESHHAVLLRKDCGVFDLHVNTSSDYRRNARELAAKVNAFLAC